jgi:hypothetical protein
MEKNVQTLEGPFYESHYLYESKNTDAKFKHLRSTLTLLQGLKVNVNIYVIQTLYKCYKKTYTSDTSLNLNQSQICLCFNLI